MPLGVFLTMDSVAVFKCTAGITRKPKTIKKLGRRETYDDSDRKERQKKKKHEKVFAVEPLGGEHRFFLRFCTILPLALVL